MQVWFKEIKEELGKANIPYREWVKGGELTTFGSGGAVAFVLFPRSEKELVRSALILFSFGVPYRVIGGGSNVLIASAGFEGAIIKTSGLSFLSIEGGRIEAGAGVKMPLLAKAAEEAGLTGLEFACGIPGEAGGAVKTNASAFGQSVSDSLKEITVLLKGKTQRIEKEALSMRYHDGNLPRGAIVLSAVFELDREARERICERMDRMKEKRAASQPRERSAGSVFRRAGDTPAAIYIEKTGLKGLRIGGAVLSEKHCNFIVNAGGATSEDYFSIGEIVRDKVYENEKVTLEYEVEKIGW